MIDRSRLPLSAIVALAAGMTALGVLQPPPALASPWVPAPGEGYAKVSMGYATSGLFFDDSGSLEGASQYHGGDITAYGELGIAPYVGLFGVTQLLYRGQDGSGAELGLGDLTIGARLSAKSTALAFSVDWRFTLPLSNGDRQPLHTTRVTSTELRANVGIGRSWGYSYASSGVVVPMFFGPSSNAGRIAPQIPVWLEVGVHLIPHRLTARVAFDLRVSLGQGRSLGGVDVFRSRPPWQHSLDALLGLTTKLSQHWSLDATITQTIWGERRGFISGGTLGIGYSSN